MREVAGLKTRRARDRTGLTLVEGLREAGRAVAAGLPLVRLLLCDELGALGLDGVELLRREAERQAVETVVLSTDAFQRISLREHPDGVALVARTPERSLERLRLPAQPLVLVLAGLEKPGNVGALLRSADAAGVDAVVLTDGGTDLGNPNVIRASMGSVFALPVAGATPVAARRWLRAAGLHLVAATPHARQSHWAASYRGGVAVVLGTEHAGLDASWLAAVHERVRIPMRSRSADSLNVAVAGAVILFEALRQRQA